MISAATAAKLDDWIESRRIADGTPGLSLAILDRDGVVHERAYGLANVDAKTPVSPEHLFQTGSIGKSFTAIALLQLQEEGKIDLQAPVTDYLPWFAVQTEFAPIRLHHLLTHTAGITSGIDYAPDARIQVWGLRDTWTTTPPGERFHYSNIGYKVLGLVLERVAGAPYRDTIQSRVLDRLRLKDSFPTITNEIRPRLAVGYAPAFDDRPWWPGRPLAPATWFETDTADGCLAMTAADLARYLAVLLNHGAGLISTESFEQLTCKGAEFDSETEPAWYGYGIMASLVEGHHYIGHSGGMVGYHSRMIGDLETGTGVVVLVNGPGSPSATARAALNVLRAETTSASFTFPANRDPSGVDNAANFAGVYTAPDGDQSLEFVANGRALSLKTDAGPLTLQALGGDAFATEDPMWNAFLFAFERENDAVAAVSHGGNRWVRAGATSDSAQVLPDEWQAFPGHYRSHNPWLTSFKVVERQGRLWLITPTMSDGFNGTEPLVPTTKGWFRLGDDERGPEFIRFDTIVVGVALRAVLSTGEFYRVAD